MDAKAQLITREVGPVNVSTPESVQVFEDVIRPDRKVTLDEIATKLEMYQGAVYSIVHEKLHFPSVSCR